MGEAGEVRRGRSKKKIFVAWLLLFSLLALVGLTLRSCNSDETPAPSVTSKSPRVDLDKEFGSLAANLYSGRLPEEVAQFFTQSSDPYVRLRWCRDPERVASLLASFPEQAVSEIPKSVEPMGGISAGVLSYERFAVTFANGENRLLCVVRTDEGTRVDWEAYARSSNALTLWSAEAKVARERQALVKKARQKLRDAEQLVAEMPKPSQGGLDAEQAQETARKELAELENATELLPSESKEASAEVRVFASAVNYYNFRFSDDQVWRSYSLSPVLTLMNP